MARASSRARRNRAVRFAVQIAFFALFPAAFSAGWNGVKAVFSAIGAGKPVELAGFVAFFAVLAVFTMAAGRFFCGYACAFGTLGDVLFGLFTPVRRKLGLGGRRTPGTMQTAGRMAKYAVLAGICAACFAGVWDGVSQMSPWNAFSALRAGNIANVNGAALGILLAIASGMLFVERFFCRFLCPLGAVFSLLPVLPVSAFRRRRESCLRGCGRCGRSCPVSVYPDPDSASAGECIACGRCADGCPADNVSVVRSPVRIRGNEIALVLGKAAVLAVLFHVFL